MHGMDNQVPYVQPGELLPDFLRNFWQRQVDTAEQESPDFRHPPLPLARIKKVMKSDPDVKMIAADAPILFCKACEIFIAEITARAFIVADSNKRRTLSRADIAKALSKSDQFDFLIDIVPRDEFPGSVHQGASSNTTAGSASTSMAGTAHGKKTSAQSIAGHGSGAPGASIGNDDDRDIYSQDQDSGTLRTGGLPPMRTGAPPNSTHSSNAVLDELQSLLSTNPSMDRLS